MSEKSLPNFKFENIEKEHNLIIYYHYVQQGLSYKPFQWHPDLELIYCLSGSLEIIFEKGSIFLSQDECYLIDSNTLHATKCSIDSSLIIFAIPMPLIKEQFTDSEQFYFDLHHGSKDPFYIDAQRQLKTCLLNFKEIYDKNEDHCYLLLNSIALQVLFILNKYFKIYKPGKNSETSLSEKSKHTLLNIIAYVYENYKQPLAIDNVAKLFHYQTHYFCHFFKKHTGTTFLTFCNEVRMYYAHLDVLHSHKSMQEIAIDNGFSSYDTFRKLFIEHFGTTPAKFRKNHNNLPNM